MTKQKNRKISVLSVTSESVTSEFTTEFCCEYISMYVVHMSCTSVYKKMNDVREINEKS